MRTSITRKIITYFLRGLLLTVPIFLTIYILFESISWVDSLIPIAFPGLGLITILVVVTLLGYLATTILARPFIDLFEEVINRIPLVNFIYSAIKDLIGAFVGDQKKFNKPVLVTLDPKSDIKRLGFVTQDDLSQLGLENTVAVYFPHSYNFSGNLYLLPADRVIPLDLPSSEVMKFVVSGGAAGIQGLGNTHTEEPLP